jgi:hypothetical protein
MGRHTFQHNDKTVVVGFDPPLETFFAQVWNDPNDDEPIFDFGSFPAEWESLDALEFALGFGLDPALRAKLIEDKQNAPAPSAHQRRMVAWVDEQFNKGD